MEQIFETNDKFAFDKLVVGKPVSVSGGNFFIRYSINDHPLYIQPPKCTIKQVTTKAGKKMYCDLIFNQENEHFIRWMENLENISQQRIHANRSEWFETSLELEDIESSFTSPMKIYKSGKLYIVRTNIATKAGKPTLKIYDEDENDIPIESLKENTNVMVILEMQGIRCSSSSFQIDIEMKQMMVLKTEDLFNQCIFKKKGGSQERIVEKQEDDLGKQQVVVEQPPLVVQEDSIEKYQTNDTESDNEDVSVIKIDTPSELCEVEFNLDELSENDKICIKERKDMYYQMYREARQKAKVARDLALSAYLEANRIKNTYMLDDLIDSSDESSDESDEEEDTENTNESDF